MSFHSSPAREPKLASELPGLPLLVDSSLPLGMNVDLFRIASESQFDGDGDSSPTGAAADNVVTQVSAMLSATAELLETHPIEGLSTAAFQDALAEATSLAQTATESGMVELEMQYLNDLNDPTVHPFKSIIISAELHALYQFRPTYLPKAQKPNQAFEGPMDDDIIFLNATNEDYYRRYPDEPIATVWCLLDDDENFSYSTRRMAEEAFKMNIKFMFVAAKLFDLIICDNMQAGLVYKGEWIPLPDSVIVRFGATIGYSGLSLLRQLDLMEVPVMNGADSIEISRDKLFTHQVLSNAGIPIPRNVLGCLPPDTSTHEELEAKYGIHLSFPMILKCLSGSCGDAVWKVDSPEDMLRQLPAIRAIAKETPIVFQEFVSSSSGRDLRIVVANGKIVSGMMRIASTGFKANFHQGGRVRKVDVSPELAEMAIKVARVSKLDIAGVDVLMGSDKYLICEVNSSPGFEGLERASRVNVAREFIQAALDRIEFDRLSKRLIHKYRDNAMKIVSIQADHLD